MKPIRLGTRPSALALWQANWTRDALEKNGVAVEIVKIVTSGDVRRDAAVANIGAQGVFTKEIQKALALGEIDLAVHSLKDLPVERVPGLQLTAVPPRADFRDVFVSNRFSSLDALPPGAVVGTCSARRRSLLARRSRGAWDVRDVRGNVETRLKKLDSGEFDALILAFAGLNRLGFSDRARHFLAPPEFLPAVGQGALGLETRVDDDETNVRVAKLADEATFLSVLAERSLLSALQGGCLAPIGALGAVEETDATDAADVGGGKKRLQTASLDAQILSFDGRTAFQTQGRVVLETDVPFSEKKERVERLGRDVARRLLDDGATETVEEIRRVRDAREAAKRR